MELTDEAYPSRRDCLLVVRIMPTGNRDAGKFPADATQLPTGCQPESLAKPARRRSHKATQPQLLTRRELDARTSATKAFDRLVADIESDLGGSDRLSAIERALVKGFAGAAVTPSSRLSKK